jgi:hypothetical protein
MLGLFVLALALGAIVRIAKVRGATPWVWALVAGGGYLVLGVVAQAGLAAAEALPPSGLRATAFVAALVAPWIPVALVLLYVRFAVGRRGDGPFGRWTCPSCRSINEQYALKCESCGETFAHPSVT